MWLSVMTRWPSSRSVRARQSPRIVERMWPTCIGLATFGELKSMTDGPRRGGCVEKQCSPRAAASSVCGQHGRFQPEIQKARAGDLDLLAQFRRRPASPARRWRAGADSSSAPWPATSARCSGNRRISGRDTGGPEPRRHRRPAGRREPPLAALFNVFVGQHGLLNVNG